jgi:hypothetical protein
MLHITNLMSENPCEEIIHHERLRNIRPHEEDGSGLLQNLNKYAVFCRVIIYARDITCLIFRRVIKNARKDVPITVSTPLMVN